MAVLLLVLTGIFLIVLNVHVIVKDKGTFKENLRSSMENVDGNKIKMGKLRIEIAESFLSIQTDVLELKRENKLLAQRITLLEDKNSIEPIEPIKPIVPIEPIKEEIKEIPQIIAKHIDEPVALDTTDEDYTYDNNDAIEMKKDGVQKLLSMGFSVDEVAAKLCTPKGEVILIKNLYLK